MLTVLHMAALNEIARSALGDALISSTTWSDSPGAGILLHVSGYTSSAFPNVIHILPIILSTAHLR